MFHIVKLTGAYRYITLETSSNKGMINYGVECISL